MSSYSYTKFKTTLLTYEEERKQTIARINELEKSMISKYEEHIKGLLTNPVKGITCIDVKTSQVETIRTRRYDRLYEDENFRMEHTLTFMVSPSVDADADSEDENDTADVRVSFNLVWTNYRDGKRCESFGETSIYFDQEYDENGEPVFIPDNTDTHQFIGTWFMDLQYSYDETETETDPALMERMKLLASLTKTFKGIKQIQPVFKCIHLISENVSKFKW